MHEGRQHQRQQEAKAPVQAEGGSEQKVEGLERCDSAYLPRVQPLTDMAPISDDSSRSLTVQVPSLQPFKQAELDFPRLYLLLSMHCL